MSSRDDELRGWLPTRRLLPFFEPPAPLTVLWTWPAGGAGAWLDSLGLDLAVHRLAPGEVVSGAAELRRGELGVVSPPEDGIFDADLQEALAEAVGGLEAGAGLVLAGAPCPETGLLPTRRLGPRQLALARAELEEAVAVFGQGEWSEQALDQLEAVTGGWIEPALWLIERTDPSRTSPEERAGAEDFARFLECSVLGRLAPDERSVLAEVLAADELAPGGQEEALWRRHYLDDPPRLAAFEALARRRGLLGVEAPPPRLLRLALPASRVDRPALASGLARAAVAEGRLEEAAAWLRLSGDFEAQARFEPPPPVPAAPDVLSSESRSGKPVFRVRLLGPPTISRLGRDGREEELSWRLQRALLCVARLALAPDYRLPRDELVETLWPGAPADHVRRNFHPTLSSARAALAGGESSPRASGIVHRQGTYGLDPEVEWQVDVEVFEQQLERAAEAESAHPEVALDALQEAWRLYRGRLLGGYDAEWVEEPRQRLHRHYLGMLGRLGDLASAAGRETLSLDAYRCLLLEEPFEERIHVELMEIYGRRGRRDLVRRQFVRLQELLKDLHVEPDEETVERYHQLMG